MWMVVGLVLVQSYGCNTNIFCYIIRVVDVVVSIALLWWYIILHNNIIITIMIILEHNHWLITFPLPKMIGDMSKPSIVTWGIFASASLAIVGNRSRVAAICMQSITMPYCTSTWTHFMCSSWFYLPRPVSNTRHSLPSLPSCTFTTSKKSCISCSNSTS